MSMTDINMTTEDVLCAINNLKGMYQSSLDKDETYLFAIQALEEIQEYREIGTVKEIRIKQAEFVVLSKRYLADLKELMEYQKIGTVEELKHLEEYVDTINKLCADYSAIGTIEEFKALKEKNTPMKHHHTRIDNISDEIRVSVCPNCLSIMYTHSEEYPVFCNVCGQKLDWQ